MKKRYALYGALLMLPGVAAANGELQVTSSIDLGVVPAGWFSDLYNINVFNGSSTESLLNLSTMLVGQTKNYRFVDYCKGLSLVPGASCQIVVQATPDSRTEAEFPMVIIIQADKSGGGTDNATVKITASTK